MIQKIYMYKAAYLGDHIHGVKREAPPKFSKEKEQQ